MLWVLTQLVGPPLSAVINGVSYLTRLEVNDLYTARLRCRGCGTTPGGCWGTQNAIRCPDFFVVIRRDHPVGARRVGTGLNADERALCKLRYRVIACFDLIDRYVGAVGQEIEPEMRIDKADVERIEAARHGDDRGFCKSLIRGESRSGPSDQRCPGPDD